MIAADTSSLGAFLLGDSGGDVDQIAAAMSSGQLVLPPVVITELLSASESEALARLLLKIEILEPGREYWQRAGQSRRLLLQKGFKAKVADTLIAQSCIDHNAVLVTRDGDFRHFAKHCGLKLI